MMHVLSPAKTAPQHSLMAEEVDAVVAALSLLILCRDSDREAFHK